MALRTLKGIRELRFILCQTSSSSQGLRKYIANNYQSIRQSKANITIRQSEGSNPFAIATYAYGVEQRVNLKKMSENQIQGVIKGLEEQSQSIAQEIKI